eukprot:Rmarinus@m.15093
MGYWLLQGTSQHHLPVKKTFFTRLKYIVALLSSLSLVLSIVVLYFSANRQAENVECTITNDVMYCTIIDRDEGPDVKLTFENDMTKELSGGWKSEFSVVRISVAFWTIIWSIWLLLIFFTKLHDGPVALGGRFGYVSGVALVIACAGWIVSAVFDMESLCSWWECDSYGPDMDQLRDVECSYYVYVTVAIFDVVLAFLSCVILSAVVRFAGAVQRLKSVSMLSQCFSVDQTSDSDTRTAPFIPY